MDHYKVAVVRYEKPVESVEKAIEMSGGFPRLATGARVFVKPNIVFWTRETDFPKWGVITTSRVVEDTVIALKKRGVDHIIIGEGMVTWDPKDRQTPAHAFEGLGYGTLKKRYGVSVLNVFERPFEKVDVGGGVSLNFNSDILGSDVVVNLPVLKSHNQTIVSLGIKNLKGTIDIPSRKKCHSMRPGRDLHVMVSRLAERMPPMFTLIDGIFSLERGPGPDGRMHRNDLLVASRDVLAADQVGAALLGHAPEKVPHLVHAARHRNRLPDLSDVEILGEPLAGAAVFHAHDFPFTTDPDGNWLPESLVRQGIRGLSYPKADLSMCTYCAGINGLVLSAIRLAWKGERFDDMEILTGKFMTPSPGKKKTVLLGKCMYRANRDHPAINHMIPVKGCPPDPLEIVEALHQAGIPVDPSLFADMDRLPGTFMARYKDRPEFDPSFFQVF